MGIGSKCSLHDDSSTLQFWPVYRNGFDYLFAKLKLYTTSVCRWILIIYNRLTVPNINVVYLLSEDMCLESLQ